MHGTVRRLSHCTYTLGRIKLRPLCGRARVLLLLGVRVFTLNEGTGFFSSRILARRWFSTREVCAFAHSVVGLPGM